MGWLTIHLDNVSNILITKYCTKNSTQLLRMLSDSLMVAHLMNSNDDVTIRNNTTNIMCPVTPAPVNNDDDIMVTMEIHFTIHTHARTHTNTFWQSNL